MEETKPKPVELKFEGGPCDGGVFALSIEQADVGYKVEWVVKTKPMGLSHLYESETVLLLDSDTLTMSYAGKALEEEEWRPGIYDMTDDAFFGADGGEDIQP